MDMKKSTILFLYVIAAMFLGAGVAIAFTDGKNPAWIVLLMTGIIIKEAVGSKRIKSLMDPTP